MGSLILHPKQLSGLQAQNPVLLLVGGIRAGKTHLGAVKTVVNAIDHPCAADEYHAVVSPTYPMSAVPIEKIFSILYDRTIFPECPLIEYSRKDRVFTLRARNGVTRIRVFSMHEPNRIRGFKIKSIWYDKNNYNSLKSWKVLQGRVADTAGHIWITTTPAGYNWVYDLYAAAQEEKSRGIPLQDRTHRVIHFTSLENPFIKDKSGFDRLLSSYDEVTYQQEVMARFIKATGLVYYPFSRQRNVVKGEINPKLPLWIGQDFNVGMMATSIAQPITVNGKMGAHILHERLTPNSNTEALITFLHRFTQIHGIPRAHVTICPDASGKARSTSGKSDYELLRSAGYTIDAPMANPFVRDRVNNVCSLLAPREHPSSPRLLVDPSCVRHIESFEKQSYDKGDPPMPDKKLGFDHIMDAVGYFTWRKLPLRGRLSLGGVPQTRRAA